MFSESTMNLRWDGLCKNTGIPGGKCGKTGEIGGRGRSHKKKNKIRGVKRIDHCKSTEVSLEQTDNGGG